MKSLEKHRRHLATVTNFVLITEEVNNKNKQRGGGGGVTSSTNPKQNVGNNTMYYKTPDHSTTRSISNRSQQNTETYRACLQKTGKTKTMSTRSEET